jgi:arsenate reductase
MAEALANARFPAWQAFSAGTHPTGTVHPMALQVLHELGIQHHGVSKPVEDFREQEFDLVVTVCDDANEECPIWLGRGKRAHESFRDPAKAEGTDNDRLAVFRQVREEISEKLTALLK